LPNIDNLIGDIYRTIVDKNGGVSHIVSENYSRHTQDVLAPASRKAPLATALHASKIGKNCLRQMWYGQWMPDTAESLQPHTLIKFTYGDLVEELALDLVKGSGHTVTHEQTRIEFPTHNGFTVSGRLDAVVDGFVVDVKSTSPYSFKDWAGKPLTADNDSFGYRWQLHSYGKAALEKQVDANTERGYLLLMDKQNGHMALSWVDYDFKAFDYRLKIITETIRDAEKTPPRAFDAVDKDRAGNLKLETECSYCDYKRTCWSDRDIKGVVRSGKVVWLVSPKEGAKTVLKPGEIAL
jgi:hypothetical protein